MHCVIQNLPTDGYHSPMCSRGRHEAGGSKLCYFGAKMAKLGVQNGALARKAGGVSAGNSQTWGNITIIHLNLCRCGVKMTMLGVQNDVLAQRLLSFCGF